MDFTPMTDDLNVIAALSDEPNETDGLDADALKAKFDEAALKLQRYINETLLPELQSAGAAGKLGFASVEGLPGADTVQLALEALLRQQQEQAQGGLPDGSVTTDKLAALCVTADKLAEGAVSAAKLSDRCVTREKLSDGAVDNSKTNFSTGFAPSGPIVLTEGVHYFASESDLPAPGNRGRLYFVKAGD